MKKEQVTQLLVRLKSGENEVYEKLYPLIYDELRGLAYRHMKHQRADHTLSKTELVHEAYLKMIDQTTINFSDKSHFLAIASKCMRQILIDHARKKHAQKRGGKNKDLTYIDEIFSRQKKKAKELIDIDDALNELEKLNERLAKVVEMRFFGEMTIEDTAEALNISKSTVKRDWMKARGWLYKELKGKFDV
ncbi:MULTISPECIES: sigma-70 family RNA polymerase sigma factor [Gracilimonas]|uniref:Sigma-70 family RNA polymerase sigma factor n=1 Tax=Gracilimonas sediminicola TaxID=2952158 RepID=A0A9X2L135_9BACT|nr:sigma-70 family RNA polymerase sigma factor [Gracilimonas sediminicola]MCP9290393.1 sigma-70 family RNA polymerase sigma factor [Gracilimonas sediminicola]